MEGKRFMKRAVVVLAVLLCSIAGFAQQPSSNPDPATPEQVTRIFKLLDIDTQMKAMSGAMKQQTLAMAMKELKKQHPEAPPAMIAEVQAAYEEMFAGMFNTMSGSLLSEIIGPVYQKHLSRAEADAVINFYSSPEGQSFMKKGPVIMVEAMQTMMPKLQEQMAGLGDQFKVRMEAIMAKYKTAK
jgi:hypothetical protein